MTTVQQDGVPRHDSDEFYASLPPFSSFAAITDREHYASLPDEWVIGIADVVRSTEAIAHGRYKAVNTVGAAVIAAAINALPDLRFPFVFGGDGASLAVPERHAAIASDALARTATWAKESLDLALRVAMIPVIDVRAAGFDVRVARYAASHAVSYAMFSGGGLAWADTQLKAGRFAIDPAEPGAKPNLKGLFCGFAPIKAQRGVILSLIAVPLADARAFAALVGDLLLLLDGSGRAGRPFPDTGPLPAWTGSGLERSVAGRAVRGKPLARGAALLRAIRLRLIHATGVTIGGFSPSRYRRQLIDNTDFRKFDDGLRMTVDCTPAVADAIEERMAAAQTGGVARVGSHRQASANLTCYVPSRLRADHVHFVDGAMGGYAAAAAKLKAAVAV